MTNTKTQTQFLLVLILGITATTFFILKPFLSTLILATIFAVVLYPLYKKILQKINTHESLAALITILIGTICILIPLTFLGTQLFQEILQVYNSFSGGENKYNLIYTTIESVGKISIRLFPETEGFFTNLLNNVDPYIKQGLIWLINNVGNILSSLSKLALDLFIFLIALYYLLRDEKKLKIILLQIIPLEKENQTIIFRHLQLAINSIVRGKILIAIIQGILTSVGFTLFGIPNSILWGAIAIIVSLVPPIGTALVIIPGVIYLFVIGNYLPAIGLLLWGIIIVGLIDNILGPKLMSKDLQLNPLVVLVSVLGGLIFFGPIGIFLGPLIISLLFIFLSVYRETTSSSKQ